jgi:hypothetical protein
MQLDRGGVVPVILAMFGGGLYCRLRSGPVHPFTPQTVPTGKANFQSELLRSVCRILVEVGGLRMAWVGYRELNQEKTVRSVAQAGYSRPAQNSLIAPRIFENGVSIPGSVIL